MATRRSRDGPLHYTSEPKTNASRAERRQHHHLPTHNHNGHKITPGIEPEGESGRRGFHPFKFLKICMRSSSKVSAAVNILWPFVPAGIALFAARPDLHLWVFIVNYIAMVPAANLLGFAGQEFARKLPRVAGIILETTFGSLVEIILFLILIITQREGAVQIIKAAILGSILANLLLCLGLCFFAGGMKRDEQVFHEAISEVGSGLLLVAGMGLVVPAAFAYGAGSSENNTTGSTFEFEVLRISRATAIILMSAFFVYLWFQARSHHGLYDEILLQDEHKDDDRHRDLAKAKLTMTEAVIGILIALACVTAIAYFLVQQIHYLVEERHLKDAFIGLILIPLVEKAAEHLTAIDEAWDNQMNFALAHVLGSSIQTALFNTPLVVMVGWGLGYGMDLRFEMFDAIVLILAILVVGNFLRDKKSNYLEGALCVMVYLIIAVAAYYYPDPKPSGGEGGGGH